MTKQEQQSIAAHIAAHADEALERAGELAEVPEARAALEALGDDFDAYRVAPEAGVVAGVFFALGRSYQSEQDAAVLRQLRGVGAA